MFKYSPDGIYQSLEEVLPVVEPGVVKGDPCNLRKGSWFYLLRKVLIWVTFGIFSVDSFYSDRNVFCL